MSQSKKMLAWLFPRRHGQMGRRVIVARLLMLWVLIVTLYFLWEANRYSGLYALLAEWQFEQFGQYWPALTLALLILVFGSPFAGLLRSRDHADRRDLPDRRGREAAVSTSSRFARLLFAFAGGLAGAALLTLLWTLTLPRIAPAGPLVALGSSRAIDPPLGAATVRGRPAYTRTSAFAQDLLVTSRAVRFAPILAPGEDDRTIRYFVELLPDDFGPQRATPTVSDFNGVLMRNTLPGSIVRLYRYAGYRIDSPSYVLYTSDKTLRWPYYVTAAQLAIGALLSLLAALLQRRHVRRISGAPRDQDSATTA